VFPHALRHTMATNYLAAGVDITYVQQPSGIQTSR
jgi:site-specific recombinase XerD